MLDLQCCFTYLLLKNTPHPIPAKHSYESPQGERELSLPRWEGLREGKNFISFVRHGRPRPRRIQTSPPGSPSPCLRRGGLRGRGRLFVKQASPCLTYTAISICICPISGITFFLQCLKAGRLFFGFLW